MPLVLVVKNASKMRSLSSGAMPGPESATAISTLSGFASADGDPQRPRPIADARIASMALTIRFSTTCCNCTLSASTPGAPSASSICREIRSLSSWPCTSAKASSMSALTASGASPGRRA